MKKKEQLRHKYILYLKKTKKNETKSGKEKELEKKERANNASLSNCSARVSGILNHH